MHGALLKLARANRHIRDLENLSEVFVADNPNSVIVDKDVQTGNLIVRTGSQVKISSEVSTITGDALHNLRSSLDHLAAHAITSNGNTASINTQFPICGAPTELDNIITNKLAGASSRFMDFVRSIKPYRDGGDGVVFALSRLNNLDKHNSLIPNVSVHTLHDLKFEATNPSGGGFTINTQKLITRGGIFNVAMLPSDAIIHLNSCRKVSLEILFRDTGIVDGESIIDTLKNFSERCRKIIDTAEF